MPERLLGSGTSGTGADAGAGAVHASQFTCVASGDLTTIKVYCRANGNVRVGIYSDSGSDLPQTLLAESNSTAVTATAWRDVSLTTSPTLVSGTKYWLAMQLSANGVVAYRYASVKRSLQTWTYGAFPSTHTSGYSDVLLEYCLDGWGDVGTPVTISAVSATATAELLVPTVTVTQTATIQPPAAEATASCLLPVASIGCVISPPAGLSTVDCGLPTIFVGTVAQPSAAESTASCLLPVACCLLPVLIIR